MKIRELEKQQRPREKLLAQGAGSLSDAELLAIFLRTGVAGYSAIEMAHYLLKHFGGIRQLLAASERDFCAVRGMGPAKYVQLQACIELSQRFLAQQLKQKQLLNSVEETSRFLISKLRDKHYEVFCCLYLDNRHQLIHFEELFRGNINSASVYPAEVVKQALKYNAAAMIVAHNHPSGICEPSQSDYHITRQLKEALQLMDIRLLDHIIIGESQTTSLAQLGEL